MTLKHTTVVVTADDGTSEVGSNEWNADHTISGNSLTLQYNNAGSLSEMSGTSWDNTNRALTLTGATVTTSNPILNLSQTWNAAVAFTGMLLNITKTSAAAGSLIFDYQLGGTSVFNLDINSNITLAAATTLQPRMGIRLTTDSIARVLFGLDSADAPFLAFGPGSAVRDVFLYRDAAGILALRNSTNAQALRVYQTFTDASNYSSIRIDYGGVGQFRIWDDSAGTGVGKSFGIFAGADLQLSGDTSSGKWTIVANSGLLDGATYGSYLTWAGQSRVTSDFNTGNSTTLANITGLSVSVAAGKTYSFCAYLSCTDAAAGGVKVAIGGTATATSIVYDGVLFDSNTVKNGNASALGTAVINTTTTATTGLIVLVHGTITVNVAGTLTVQLAQNTGNATGTVALRGSYFFVHQVA